MVGLWKKIFPQQTRESELECAVTNCVKHIINNPNDFEPCEQIYIAGTVLERVKEILGQEAVQLAEELKEKQSRFTNVNQ